MPMEEEEVVSLDYRLQWQVPVCALIFIIPLVVASVIIIKRRRRRRTSRESSRRERERYTYSVRPADMWVPCWRDLHPGWLLFYRVFALATMAGLLYLTVATIGLFAFFFYTQWTFALVTVYMALASIISMRGCWMYSRQQGALSESSERDKEVHYIDRSTGFLETCMQIVYQTCAGAVVLTDVVFWCILVPFVMRDSFKLTLLIGCMHSANVVVLLLDSAFNSLPFNWDGFTYFVLWSCSYVVFQWVLHACCITWWPYPFLELSTPWAPLWYLALALIHIPCYGLYMMLVKAKNSLFSKIFPRLFVRWY